MVSKEYRKKYYETNKVKLKAYSRWYYKKNKHLKKEERSGKSPKDHWRGEKSNFMTKVYKETTLSFS